MRWEYKIVRADWFSGGLMTNSETTGKLTPLESYIADLGDQGWEAVNVQHAPNLPSGSRLMFLFKRPKDTPT